VETFQVLVLLALGLAFFRRLVLRPRRLSYNADAYVVLSLIAVLMVSAFLATSTLIAYQPQPWERWAYVSWALASAWSGLDQGTLLVRKSAVSEKRAGQSAMLPDLIQKMSKPELRDLIEYLASLKQP